MTFVAFKAIDSALNGQNGGFDPHTLPPITSTLLHSLSKALLRRPICGTRLFRVSVPVSSIELATDFYSRALNSPGTRVSLGRRYLDVDNLAERSFYWTDPFGKKLCFVREVIPFTGGLL